MFKMTKVKIISETTQNFKSTFNYKERLVYTIRHRKAYREVEKKLTGKNSIKGYFHDLNKIFMYLIGMPTETVHNIHQKLSPHHIKNGKVKDPTSAIIDWECARYTKPDKPLPAFETFKILFPQGNSKIEELLKKFGLWKNN